MARRTKYKRLDLRDPGVPGNGGSRASHTHFMGSELPPIRNGGTNRERSTSVSEKSIREKYVKPWEKPSVYDEHFPPLVQPGSKARQDAPCDMEERQNRF